MGSPKKVKKLFLLAHKGLRRNKYKVFLFASISFSWVAISVALYSQYLGNPTKRAVLGSAFKSVSNNTRETLISPVANVTEIPTPKVTPTNTPTPVPTIPPKNYRVHEPTDTPTPTLSNPSQYTAEKINDVTWKVSNLENDANMASPQDIVNAINSYRGSRGLSNLSVDGYLTSYAQERANLFSSNGSLDSHAGFRSFMDNGGFERSGFNSLGENSAYVSGPMNGDKIVKSLFGADPSHDSNQLDNWTHIGVGVNGNAVNVNFGKGKR